MTENQISQSGKFSAEVRKRFGVLPNFFSTASSAPGLIEKMWDFAKSAYLDNPLPSLFKERLFVHLSRFCEIRYCIVRHVGFLIGEGNPAGDAEALPHTAEQALTLLRRRLPDADRLELALVRLEGRQMAVAVLDTESECEGDLFDALTIMFVAPQRAERARKAITAAVGEMAFECLAAFLAFVRTAHYWTETHPTLAYEADMIDVMERYPDLANLMLDTKDPEWAQSSQALRRALSELQSTAGALRTSEERFRAFVTATSDVVYRMSPDWTKMWQLDGRGFIVDTANPSEDWLTKYIHPDDQAHVLAVTAEAVRKKSLFELEHRVRRVDGSLGWTLSRAVPLLDDQGAITEWFGAARDVTARRCVEETLREGDRRKDEFLATLAHELRNPLAPLGNGLQIARLDSKPGSPFQRTIAMMQRQLNQLVHLVDDLLDVARISTGKIELRRQRVSLQEVLTASAEACRAAIDERGQTLTVESASEELWVEGDFDRLTQVFSNLLSNATKYTERGEKIELQLKREGREATVRVCDSGIGIPTADLPHVFELFSQAKSHSGRSEGGLGIGLSLVRKIMEMHGGSVAATSPGAGGGSTFTVRMPLTQKTDVVEKPERPERSRRPVSRHRILVVDDNQDSAMSLAMLLEGLGHEVDTACDGLEGVAKAESMRPDLIFLDLGMPRMNGIEAAKHIRALPGGNVMTLVALTGWAQEQDLQRTREAGFHGHLLKPIDSIELDRLLAAPASRTTQEGGQDSVAAESPRNNSALS